MHSSMFVDPEKVKKESEQLILHAGGDINESLPLVEDDLKLRHLDDITNRTLVMNALLQVHIGVPMQTIGRWIAAHRLEQSLTPQETSLVEKATGALTEEELVKLFWYKESIWVLLWAGSIVDAIPFDQQAGRNMVSFLPSIAENQSVYH